MNYFISNFQKKYSIRWNVSKTDGNVWEYTGHLRHPIFKSWKIRKKKKQGTRTEKKTNPGCWKMVILIIVVTARILKSALREGQRGRGLIKAIKYDRELCLIVFQAGPVQRKMSDFWHYTFYWKSMRLCNLCEVMQRRVEQQRIYVCDPPALGFICKVCSGSVYICEYLVIWIIKICCRFLQWFKFTVLYIPYIGICIWKILSDWTCCLNITDKIIHSSSFFLHITLFLYLAVAKFYFLFKYVIVLYCKKRNGKESMCVNHLY